MCPSLIKLNRAFENVKSSEYFYCFSEKSKKWAMQRPGKYILLSGTSSLDLNI
jgi:hypothetical protein